MSESQHASLSITLTDNDTALSRLLGVVRRRGFSLRALHASQDGAGKLMVSMAVESTRPVELLVRQIAKVIEVEVVQVQHAAPAVAVA